MSRRDAQMIGLMMTRNEVDVIEEVMREHCKYFDIIFVLDGSNDGTEEIIRSFENVKFFMKDRDLKVQKKPLQDDARQTLIEKAQEMFPSEGWFTLLHGDEIFWDNPLEITKLADRWGAEKVNWQPMNFYLHRSDMDRDLDSVRSVQERVLWYNVAPVLEIRQFKNKRGIRYNIFSQNGVLPEGISWVTLPLFPIFKHYPFRHPKQILKKHQEGLQDGFFSVTYKEMDRYEKCFFERRGKMNRKFDGGFHEFEHRNQWKPWIMLRQILLRPWLY